VDTTEEREDVHMRSKFRRCAAILGAGWALGACSDGSGSGTGADGTDSLAMRTGLESVCVEVINGYRAELSLPALAEWTDSAACFARQAALDFQSRKGHANFGLCKEAAQNTCPAWMWDESIGGKEGTLRRCVESMWNEGPGTDYSKHGHYINMTNKAYKKVGCGFSVKEGSIWINMDFK